MRLRNIANARNLLEQHPGLMVLDPKKHKGKWKTVFGNGNPVFLEIGTGKGRFISYISEQMPDINFVGLEKYDSVAVRAMQKLLIGPRPNVVLARGEAENLLSYFSQGEVERIYLNFPDPWPKRSDQNRRLVHSDFLGKYRNILSPCGEIHLKTDDRAFFEFAMMHMSKNGISLGEINLDLHKFEPECNIRTEYEESRSSAGCRVYQLVGRINLPIIASPFA
jgi:tRNA (guanine-N7-)-methyltransferase